MNTFLSQRSSRWVRALIPGAAVLSGLVLLAAQFRGDLVVQAVRFEGNQRASSASLRHLVDLPAGTWLWSFSSDRVARKAEQHPWVERAEAHMVWPGEVVVTVEERQAVALVLYDGLYYVDDDGQVFLKARNESLDFPVITGLSPDMERLHPELPPLVLGRAVRLLDALARLGLVAQEQVSEVQYDDVLGFTVILSRGGRVIFGLDDHERQLRRLERLVASGVNLGAPLLIDLGPQRVAVVTPLIGSDS
ncbi:MAG: FtsQ-type POTRA domain-containing protein [Deltaproteobacteria bacterium]|nr:FtsQ-type POTRA domain-containing protein [Deltaproteobacteria bacterium]